MSGGFSTDSAFRPRVLSPLDLSVSGGLGMGEAIWMDIVKAEDIPCQPFFLKYDPKSCKFR